MFSPGEVVPYLEMCGAEGASLQRGMNFRLGKTYSVILMSVRAGAPYADRIEADGRVLIYEGHDALKSRNNPDPKLIDQPLLTPGGRLTQNGLFCEAARKYIQGEAPPELVRVYEKIKDGIWAFAGVFKLIDAWQETSSGRKVFKFRLELVEALRLNPAAGDSELPRNRMIPTAVKLAVWKRDKGKCVLCGSKQNLHFDHIIPYSKGGSSLVANNIQLLCAKHNLAKKDRIE
jgi:hypothetical protein